MRASISVLLGIFAVLVFAPAAQAAEGCVVSSTVSADDLARYQRSPGDVLQLPEGTAAEARAGLLSSRVRNLIASNPDSLAGLVPFLKVATGDEAGGLGVGLGAAAQICVKRNPLVAQDIQKAVLEANNNDLSRSFAAIIGDQPVLAVSSTPAAPVAGDTNVGGGPHRGTTDLVYGFRAGSVPDGSSSFASAGTRSSRSAFSSVSGFR